MFDTVLLLKGSFYIYVVDMTKVDIKLMSTTLSFATPMIKQYFYLFPDQGNLDLIETDISRRRYA